MIKKENKKVTMKAMFKKMTLAASLTLALAAPALSAAQTPVRAATSAQQFSATKYFPGTNPNDFNDMDTYSSEEGYSFRNFKNRSANIYVKDKELLPLVKKAAKAWAPVFKFKFVKSGKHADIASSKYANIVVYDEPNSNVNEFTRVRMLTNSKDAIAAGELKYTYYADGKFTNYKAYLAALKQMKKGTYKGDTGNNGGPIVGRWEPSSPNDIVTHGAVNYINLIVGTKNLSKAQQVAQTTYVLGMVIGLGNNDQMDDSNLYSYYVTQNDFNHVNWLYAHPWDPNKVWKHID